MSISHSIPKLQAVSFLSMITLDHQPQVSKNFASICRNLQAQVCILYLSVSANLIAFKMNFKKLKAERDKFREGKYLSEHTSLLIINLYFNNDRYPNKIIQEIIFMKK